MNERMNDRTNGRTNHERSNDRTNEQTNKEQGDKRSKNDRTILVLVGACVGGGVGVGGSGESCHEMAWGGMRGGPCPSISSHGGGLGGGMRGLVGG
jgi:hypothetical protein